MGVFADAVAVVGDGAGGIAAALSVDTNFAACAFGSTRTAVVDIFGEVGTTARTSVLSAGAVVKAVSARADLAGVALFAAGTAVIVVGCKVATNAVAFVGEKARWIADACTI